MAPSSSSEKEALELEIARLSGAIDNHHNAAGPSSYASRPSRGRPGSHPYRQGPPIKRGNKILIINNKPSGNTGSAQAGPSRLQPVKSTKSGPVSAGASGSTTPLSADGGQVGNPGWVKGTTKSGNKTLTNVDVHLKAEKAKHIRDAQPRPLKPKRRLPQYLQNYGSVETRTPGGTGTKSVVIDGVIFQFEKDGKKLTRMDDIPTTPTMTSTITNPIFGTPTRSSLSMSGKQYIRTKNGNMISAEVVRNRRSSLGGEAIRSQLGKKKEKIDKPCKYFTKTGQCQRASTCPYTHDPRRLAICSRFLRGNCPMNATTCPVSHSPSSHNAPSCSHYQMTGYCKNGIDCPYPHAMISADAPVCQAFAVEGWCEKGSDCEEKHAWECREFNETGQCSKQGKCALAHVLRAKSGVQQSAMQDSGPIRTSAVAKKQQTVQSSSGTMSADDIAEQQDFIQFLSGEEDTADSGNDEDASEESSVSSDDDDDEDDSGDESSEGEDEDVLMRG